MSNTDSKSTDVSSKDKPKDDVNKPNNDDELKIEFAKRIDKYLEGGNPSLRFEGKTREFELRFGTNKTMVEDVLFQVRL